MLVIQLTRDKGILLNIAGKKRATCSNQFDQSVADVDKMAAFICQRYAPVHMLACKVKLRVGLGVAAKPQ